MLFPAFQVDVSGRSRSQMRQSAGSATLTSVTPARRSLNQRQGREVTGLSQSKVLVPGKQPSRFYLKQSSQLLEFPSTSGKDQEEKNGKKTVSRRKQEVLSRKGLSPGFSGDGDGHKEKNRKLSQVHKREFCSILKA